MIIFDESHAMANAAGGKESAATSPPSQQGRAGLRLQHALPNARSSMSPRPAQPPSTISPTPNALACGAVRISCSPPAPNSSRRLRTAVLRRWRCWPAICARSASIPPVRSPTRASEYELVEHALTDEQRGIYDAYAPAPFAVIHNHLDAAMEAANITGATGTLNRQAKSAARSAFESAKQRFFGHLLTSMKTPALIARHRARS